MNALRRTVAHEHRPPRARRERTWRARSVVSLLDGRAELAAEIVSAPDELRRYLAEELSPHKAHPRFMDGVYAGLPPDDASQARAEEIVLPRLSAITAAG
jgi:hypothetical protein